MLQFRMHKKEASGGWKIFFRSGGDAGFSIKVTGGNLPTGGGKELAWSLFIVVALPGPETESNTLNWKLEGTSLLSHLLLYPPGYLLLRQVGSLELFLKSSCLWYSASWASFQSYWIRCKASGWKFIVHVLSIVPTELARDWAAADASLEEVDSYPTERSVQATTTSRPPGSSFLFGCNTSSCWLFYSHGCN